MATAKKRVIRVEDLRPFVNGVCDEVNPFVEAELKEYEALAATEEEARGDLGKELDEAVYGWSTHGPSRETRMRLFRVASRALALLVLDERLRGSDVVEAEGHAP